MTTTTNSWNRARIAARSRLLLATLCCAWACLLATAAHAHAAAAEDTPTAVLRRNIEAGMAVLKDPRYRGQAALEAQRTRLCDIAREVFDPYLFSKLALGSHWNAFSHDEQHTFVDTFATYLCRYYLGRLQERYRDEQVEFVGERYLEGHRAVVTAQVLWEDRRIPVEVHMAYREQRWRAYDIQLLGVSAVRVYRTQFADVLSHATPAELIARLREKTARNE